MEDNTYSDDTTINVNKLKMEENLIDNDFYIKKMDEMDNIVNFVQDKGEKNSMKLILEALFPHLDNQSEEVKKSYEYFKLKVNS
jgi:hypothetical protein